MAWGSPFSGPLPIMTALMESCSGTASSQYHLEFTRQRGHRAGSAPSTEHLLVFYVPDPEEWAAKCARMTAAGFRAVKSSNPFWDSIGATFEDVDGYRVVLANARWPE